MTAPTNNYPLQINFNSLLKSYPEVEEFCNEIRSGTITKKILAEMNKVQNTLNEGQSITIRSLTKKFTKIVNGIDYNDDRLSVAKKVTEFLEIFQAAKPDSPAIKQMHTFLEALQKNAELNEQPKQLDFNLLRLESLLSAFRPSPKHQFKLLKAEKELIENDVQLKTDAILALKNPCRFVQDIKNLKYTKLLNDKDRSAFKDEPNPEVFLKSLLLKKWDAEKIERNRLIELIDSYPNIFVPIDPHHLLLEGILHINEGWKSIIEKYSDPIETLALIFAFTYPEDRREIWKHFITSQNLEVEFLLRVRDVDIRLFFHRNRSHYKDYISNFLEKYHDHPQALAVMCRVAIRSIREKIWDHFITPQNLEIEFLSQVDLPGAVNVGSLKDNFSNSKWIDALIKKYENDGIALAKISSKLLDNKMLTKMWDEIIEPNGLEIQYLSNLNFDGNCDLDHILGKRRKCGLAQNRRAKLIKKYKKQPEALAFIKH